MMNKILVFLTSLCCSYVYAALPPTTSRGNGESSDFTTFKFRFPNISVSRSGTTTTFNTVEIAGGGTGQTTKTAGFDALSPLTTKGDLVVHDGTNNIRLPLGTDGNFLRADSSTATGYAFSSASLGLTGITTQTSNYTINAASDGTVIGNTAGGAFTVTLPTAVGISGQIFRIVKGDTSGNLLTLATTSGQTLSGLSSTVLHARGETVTVQSNGSNWVMLAGNYRIESARITAGAGSCTILSQSGTWITSIVNNSTGDCSYAFPTGLFSETPSCEAISSEPSQATFCGISGGTTPSATALRTYCVRTDNFNGGATNVNLICRGAR